MSLNVLSPISVIALLFPFGVPRYLAFTSVSAFFVSAVLAAAVLFPNSTTTPSADVAAVAASIVLTSVLAVVPFAVDAISASRRFSRYFRIRSS